MSQVWFNPEKCQIKFTKGENLKPEMSNLIITGSDGVEKRLTNKENEEFWKINRRSFDPKSGSNK